MFDISKVDGNFKIEEKVHREDVEFHNVDDVPFKIYGLFKIGRAHV